MTVLIGQDQELHIWILELIRDKVWKWVSQKGTLMRNSEGMESKTARDTERVPLRKPINLIQETFYTHNPMSSFYSPVYWLKNHKCVHISKLYWKNQCSVHACICVHFKGSNFRRMRRKLLPGHSLIIQVISCTSVYKTIQ